MKRGYFLYLGIAITYISLACIQLSRPEMLSISIYSFVAWASVELALLELIKTLSQYIQRFRLQIIHIKEDELQLCKRQAVAFAKHPKLSEELAVSKAKQHEIEKELARLKRKKDVQYLGKAVNAITFTQIAGCFIMFAICITTNTPDNTATNKMIGILSLLSFAFLFISYFVKSSADEQLAESKTLIGGVDRLSFYYLDLLEKASLDGDNDENGGELV